MGGMTVDVIDEVGNPSIRASLVRYLVDDVAETSGLGENFVDVCVLNGEEAGILQSGVAGDPPGPQLEAVNVVGRGKNALLEAAARPEPLEQGQLDVDTPLCRFSQERLKPRLEI